MKSTSIISRRIMPLVILFLTILSGGGLHAQQSENKVPNSGAEALGHSFIPESQMKEGILQMMAKFSPYLAKRFHNPRKANSDGDSIAGFRCQETMYSSEDGIRTSSDLGMAAGFLFKYGTRHGTPLPEGITYQQLYSMAIKSLVFVYSTHKSTKLARCLNNAYWGSQGTSEQFESPLWAMGMAYQAYFLWDSLSQAQRQSICRVLASESDFVLRCPVRCRYDSDTRAEENGWDVCVLAATLGLFPQCENAGKYFDRLKKLAINTLSHPSDKRCRKVIDPGYDTLTVAGAYVGCNLFSDYTLQNHGRFHPGYQNVAIQELGEAALALKIFQQKTIGGPKFWTQALMHNCRQTQDSVLNFLALPDGELAMPNGNDWSMFLFDQIAAFSTLACFLRDPDALMLECQAFKNVRIRQSTTPDGSWLLNPDIGARRMGVQAHRIVMTYLMHEACPTGGLKPSTWDSFCQRHCGVKEFRSQGLIRAASPDRAMFFSLDRKQDVSGYFVPNSPGKCKIVMPMPNGCGTGNFLGWYSTKSGYTPNIQITRQSVRHLGGGFCICAEYLVNSYYFQRRHALYCTPGNAIISLDMAICGKGSHTITEENCGALALSFDPFTSTRRLFFHEGGCDTVSGPAQWQRPSGWLNIDNAIGILSFNPGKAMRLSALSHKSSIDTRRLFTSYSPDTVPVASGSMIGKHAQVYLSNVSAAETRARQASAVVMDQYLPSGWMGLACSDSRGHYVLLANLFGSDGPGRLAGMPLPENQYFPIFEGGIRISGGKASADLSLSQLEAQAFRAGFLIMASDVEVFPVSDCQVKVTALDDTILRLAYSRPGSQRLCQARAQKMRRGESRVFEWTGRRIARR